MCCSICHQPALLPCARLLCHSVLDLCGGPAPHVVSGLCLTHWTARTPWGPNLSAPLPQRVCVSLLLALHAKRFLCCQCAAPHRPLYADPCVLVVARCYQRRQPSWSVVVVVQQLRLAPCYPAPCYLACLLVRRVRQHSSCVPVVCLLSLYRTVSPTAD